MSVEIEAERQADDEAEEVDSRARLEAEMGQLLTATERGVVEADIRDIRPDEDGILVEAELPSGETFTERMSRPDEINDRYKFVRFCRQQGATVDEFTDLVVGSTAQVERDDDGEWRIYAPLDRGAIQQFRGLLAGAYPQDDDEDEPPSIVLLAVFTVLYPLFFVADAYSWVTGDWDDNLTKGWATFWIGALTALVWSVPAIAIVFFFF